MSLGSPEQPRPKGPRRRLLADPLSIRALAHPLRLELQSIIGREGKITAAAAARELGISQALASHHLRQLAKYGFVEQAAGADNRERPWQLVSTSTSWRGMDETPEGAAAVDVLEQVIAERALTNYLDWQERRGSWSPGWREHAGLGRSTIYLTEPEFADLARRIDALLVDYIEQRPLDDLSARPPDAVPVEMTFFAVPAEPTSSGN
ncbi:MAG: helix-turn-helix domain-containing protein [Candidatus Dormiibacterota bacterium]